jgi:hypothetical protein
MPLTLFTAQGDTSSAGLPSDTSFAYGASGATGPAQAVGGPRVLLSKQFFPQAAPKNPGATGADNVLAVYSLPANTFDTSGRSISIRAVGLLANNANVKTVKLIFNATTAVVGSTVTGGSTVASTSTFSTAVATGFSIEGEVFKTGVAGANTQTGVNSYNLVGATSVQLLAPVAATAAENKAILIAVTGNAATTATDIGLLLLEVTARC